MVATEQKVDVKAVVVESFEVESSFPSDPRMQQKLHSSEGLVKAAADYAQ